MRRLFSRRRAISTIIAGIIVLILLMTSLGTMVFITRQYDSYQSTLNRMSQYDTDRISESITPVSPGIAGPSETVPCNGGSCNQYTMILQNNGPSEVQIVQIYINSTSVCTPLCHFNPSNATVPFGFQESAALIDPSDLNHMLFWLPASMSLPQATNANTFSIVTARGRVFTFQWISPVGVAVPSEHRLDIGPLRIVYDNNLLAFTQSAGKYVVPGPAGCANSYPSPTACYPSGWYDSLPSGTLTFYIRLSNIGGAPVRLLDSSYLLAEGAYRSDTTQRDLAQFYIVMPMPEQPCYDTYFSSSDFEVRFWPRTGMCPTPSTIQGYNASYLGGQCNLSNPCYELDNATLGYPGRQTYVLFGAQTPKGSSAVSLKPSYDYFLYLELSYIYLGYEYSISIPLIDVNT